MSVQSFFTASGWRGTHSRLTRQPTPKAKGSIVSYFAFAVVCATGVDAVATALLGQWIEATVCIVSDVALVVAWRAWLRRQTCQRWHDAIQRRDELKRLRADRVRLHKPVKDIDAELQPLVARMIAGHL